MNLELHRREEAKDTSVSLSKVFPHWLTEDQYKEIPLDEAAILARTLTEVLPAETLKELTRLLSDPKAIGSA